MLMNKCMYILISSSCCADSTDFPDSLAPFISIIH